MGEPRTELYAAELEELLDSISDAVDDPALSDDEAREEVRRLLSDDDSDDGNE
jgi:hypothetical protein